MISSCGKEYSSEELRPVLGSWQFTKGGTNYSGYLNNVYSTSGIGSNVMYIIGSSSNGSQQFQIKLFGSSFSIGKLLFIPISKYIFLHFAKQNHLLCG